MPLSLLANADLWRLESHGNPGAQQLCIESPGLKGARWNGIIECHVVCSVAGHCAQLWRWSCLFWPEARIQAEPVATLEFEKDRAVAAPADHPTRWRFWPEPESLQEMLTTQDLDPVFAIEHELRACIAFEHRPRKWQLLKAYRRLPATGAMAFGADERRTIELDGNLCAVARHDTLCHAATP